jgi:hypothetical protein
MLISSVHPLPSPTYRPYWRFAAVVVLGVLGAALSLQMWHAADGAAGRVGEGQRTSFGTVSVLTVDVLEGLDPHALGGASHGVQGLVAAGETQIAVSVRLSNSSDHAVDYSPKQFRLRAPGQPKPVPATAGSLQPGVLAPGASIDARLAFVTRADGSDQFVEFTDGDASPVRIDVGRTDHRPVPPVHPHR